MTGDTVDVAIGGAAGSFTTARGADGAVCWVQLHVGPHGSTLAGIADALATAITIGLQQGAPASAYADALRRLELDRPAADGGDLPASLADCLRHHLDHAAVDSTATAAGQAGRAR